MDCQPAKETRQSIRIATLNVEGAKSNALYIYELLKKCEIICIQEHWLHNFEVDDLISKFPDHKALVKCEDDDDPVPPMMRRRAHAGTAILWCNELDNMIEPVLGGSDRVAAIVINTEPEQTILVNTYMPTEGAASADYAETLDEVFNIYVSNCNKTFIWCGDINASITRNRSKNDSKLTQFCIENHLRVAPMMPDCPTFHHYNGKSQSAIDMFIHAVTYEPINHIEVDQRNPLNTGCHDPVIAHMTAHLKSASKRERKTLKQPPPKKVNWIHVDIPQYREKTENKLQALMKDIDKMPTEILSSRINSILTTAAQDASVERPRKTRRKYKWVASFRPMAENIAKCYNKLREIDPQHRAKSEQQHKLNIAKKILRRAQRQAAAKQRLETKQALIDECHLKGKDGFYDIIRKHRSTKTLTTNVEFNEHEDPCCEEQSWANYFCSLATPKEDAKFDSKYKRHLEINHLLQTLLASSTVVEEVNQKEIENLVRELKNRKAPDIHGIQAEHIKYAPESLIPIICRLTSSILQSGKLPNSFKTGCVTPVLKKGKPPKITGNYRRITITSIVGKVVEKYVLTKVRANLDKQQSRLQFGFTKGTSPIHAAILLTETIAESKDANQEILITLMDTAKAFDVVSHKSMLNALFQQGVTSNLWQIFDSLYTDIASTVKWKGTMSEPFNEQQGIRQGGASSADCYKAGKNPLLHLLDSTPSYRLGQYHCGAIMVADDLALISSTQQEMQLAISTAEIDASRERYNYNTEKNKVLTVATKATHNTPALNLNNKRLGTSTKEAHLGILRNQQGSNMDTVQDRVSKARRAAYSLMGAGFHGYNGVGPEVASIQYTTYIVPTLLYGLEALVLEDKELQILECYHRRTLRQIQHLPKSTANAAVHLLIGIPPAEALLHIKVLTTVRDIAAAKDETLPAVHLRNIMTRQAAMKDAKSASWTSFVKKILRRYNLPTLYHILEKPPKKKEWKKRVKIIVNAAWTTTLCEEAEGKRSLNMLEKNNCIIGELHPTWKHISNTLEIQQATIRARLLVQRYPLASSPTNTAKTNACPLCMQEKGTTEHFLLHCPSTLSNRLPHLNKILEQHRAHQIPVDPQTIISRLLDASLSPSRIHNSLSLRFIFNLHHVRTVQLGGGSCYRLTGRT